jgi:hypothetical protein
VGDYFGRAKSAIGVLVVLVTRIVFPESGRKV